MNTDDIGATSLDNNNSNTSSTIMNDSNVANRRATLRSHSANKTAENPPLSDVETQKPTSPKVGRIYSPSELNIECRICFESASYPQLTKCGHVFCLECLSRTIMLYHECPVCRTKLDNLKRYFVRRLSI